MIYKTSFVFHFFISQEMRHKSGAKSVRIALSCDDREDLAKSGWFVNNGTGSVAAVWKQCSRAQHVHCLINLRRKTGKWPKLWWLLRNLQLQWCTEKFPPQAESIWGALAVEFSVYHVCGQLFPTLCIMFVQLFPTVYYMCGQLFTLSALFGILHLACRLQYPPALHSFKMQPVQFSPSHSAVCFVQYSPSSLCSTLCNILCTVFAVQYSPPSLPPLHHFLCTLFNILCALFSLPLSPN